MKSWAHGMMLYISYVVILKYILSSIYLYSIGLLYHRCIGWGANALPVRQRLLGGTGGGVYT